MSYPLSSGKDGIKIQPDKMEPETLYHCIHQNKIMLVYKDHNEILNCYEIDDDEIVSKVVIVALLPLQIIRQGNLG